MKKWLYVGVFTALVVLAVPSVVSAWGLPSGPFPGCKNFGEVVATLGACLIH